MRKTLTGLLPLFFYASGRNIETYAWVENVEDGFRATVSVGALQRMVEDEQKEEGSFLLTLSWLHNLEFPEYPVPPRAIKEVEVSTRTRIATITYKVEPWK